MINFCPLPLSTPTPVKVLPKEAPLMEEWRGIPSFPGYSVSSAGRVRNDKTGRLVAQCTNQLGVVVVGLSRDKKQYKRSVAVLVASAFLPTLNPKFDTTIHLDGDRSNNNMFNLDWRPRWFAVDYQQQFKNEPRGYQVPIEEVTTGEVFPTSWAAAIRYGLLDFDIVISMMKNTFVWPTYQMFRLVE